MDLLDMYDLEIEVLYIVLEYDTQSYKLNYRFKELKDAMRSLIAKWNICPERTGHIKLDAFYIPFRDHDLITESDARFNTSDYKSELDWGPQEIMEKMHATRKLIREVLDSEFVDADETRDEKKKDIIEGTKCDLPEIIEDAKRKQALRAAARQPERVTKVEVVMPETRNAEDNGIAKGKNRVYPPHFPSTAWPDVSIRFINEHDVFITAGKKSAQSDYKALGFGDEKRDTPNRAWQFLLGLARNEGATLALATPIPDNTKQLKKQLSDGLMKIFDNATDPFHNPAGTPDHVYRIKLKLIPPEAKHPKPIAEEYGTEDPDLEEDDSR